MQQPPTVRAARRRFFLANGFGADGGYDDPWAEAEFGPVVYRVPNVPARARALRIHDLHHLVTGYATDWRGEAQISAWELGAGWGRQPYAWIIALFGLFTGLLALPGATWRAFLRGRRSANLYGRETIEDLLERPLPALTRELRVPAAGAQLRARIGDRLAFAATAAAALGFGALSAPFVAGLVGLGELRRASACFGCAAAQLSS